MGVRLKVNLEADNPEDMVINPNPSLNLKYHQIAKEYVNNGLRQTAAYATVVGAKKTKVGGHVSRLFAKPEMIALIKAYLTGGQPEPLEKDWAIRIWKQMVEANVLDFMDDDGRYLSVAELRELPLYAQRAIKNLKVTTKVFPVRDAGGKIVKDEEGNRVTYTEQHVHIELVDKQKALADLAKAEKWIETHMNLNVSVPVTADALIEASQRRVVTLKDADVIEGAGRLLGVEQDEAED